jgi:hypothetical protein
MIPPTIATNNPIFTKRVTLSPQNNGESNPTHNGVVVTRTTELATVVYSSDVIQLAK